MKKSEFMNEMSKVFDDSTDKEANVNVIKSKKKAETNESFVIFFFKKFAAAIIENNLGKTDLLVLLKVLEYVSWGNVINLTQETIADDLGLKQQQISRSFKKLVDADIFIREKKSLFVNPNYMCMGDLYKSTETDAYRAALSMAYKEVEGVLDVKKKEDLDKLAHESMSFMKK